MDIVTDYGAKMFTMRHPDVPEGECYCNADRGVKCLNCVHAGIVETARLAERDRVERRLKALFKMYDDRDDYGMGWTAALNEALVELRTQGG